MSDPGRVFSRRVCCRLCLAPDNECVSIFTTSAADKEPLSSKIASCVRIKVIENDRLSPKICHACISYLNSWQSFKNRCDAAQIKQRSWIGLVPTNENRNPLLQSRLQQNNNNNNNINNNNNNSSNNNNNLNANNNIQNQQLNSLLQQQQKQQSLLTTNNQSQLRQQLVQQHQQLQRKLQQQHQLPQNQLPNRKSHDGGDNNNIDIVRQRLVQRRDSVDVSFIKQEPTDDLDDNEDGLELKMDIDPSQFLAREDDDEYNNGNDDDDDELLQPLMSMEEGPPILTSLGLTHINHVNPYGYMNSDNDYGDDSQMDDENPLVFGSQKNQQLQQQLQQRSTPIPASCSICDMKFSNRANARRHERNIHGVILNPISSINNSSLLSAITGGQPLGGAGVATSTPEMKPKIRIRAKNVPQVEVFDYDDPAKYRHLLTPSKLTFILKNLDFLEQAQDMICKCCNKQFPSYKYFMGHMRKRFHSLPRNVCFKCLRQFQSKGQFIGHLKRKNCINLYKIVMADESISKDVSKDGDGNSRLGTKDIIANKVYGCKLCTKNFRLKMDFRSHVYEEHGEIQKSKETPGAACGYCNETFEDSTLRRRHYNNLDCIVYIICGTCNDRFENHTLYIEHVYQTHLTMPQGNGSVIGVGGNAVGLNSTNLNDSQLSSGSLNSLNDLGFEQESFAPSSNLRNPQNCPVCNKQYNNYYNVLRHMESKHPDQLPQIYQCTKCAEGFPRQSELREHMQRIHGDIVVRSQVPQSLQSVQLQKLQQQQLRLGNFLCKECSAAFDTKDLWIEHQGKEHAQYMCMHCDYSNQLRDEFEEHIKEHANLKIKLFSCKQCNNTYNTNSGLRNHMINDHGISEEFLEISGNCDQDEDDNMSGSGGMAGDDIMFENSNISDSTKNGVNESALSLLNSLQSGGEDFMGNDDDSNDEKFLNFAASSGLLVGNLPARIKCRYCSKKVTTKLSLKRHMMVTHGLGGKLVGCTLCSAEFINDKGLKVHLFRAHNIREADYPTVLPADILDPQYQSTKIQRNDEFECSICHIVYRSQDHLKIHNVTVHGFDGSTLADVSQTNDTNDDGKLDIKPIIAPQLQPPQQVQQIQQPQSQQSVQQPPQLPQPNIVTTWFQCRYCNESFNTSKKLTLHMNTHEEIDQTDYTCKDCGNVYSTKKSLWVHRHKKHPRIPDPSPCDICKKIFFDKTELFYHVQTHSQQEIFYRTNDNGGSNDDSSQHDDNMRGNNGSGRGGGGGSGGGSGGSNDIGGNGDGDAEDGNGGSNESNDNSLFGSNHPLLQFFDAVSGVGDNPNNNSNKRAYSQLSQSNKQQSSSNSNEEYACDMCPKTFPILNALQVHRGWHFRSPDGRKVRDPSETWQPDQLPPSKVKRMMNTKAATGSTGHQPTCPYCSSTFASGNNLRRHIVEVHKRNESKMMREKNNMSPTVFIEKVRECQTCQMSFKTSAEWIDHKIMHARTQKPSTTFEWGCEICGKVFTRKERLLQHMITHLNSKEFDDDNSQQSSNLSSMQRNHLLNHHGIHNENSSQYENNSQSSMNSSQNGDHHHHHHHHHRMNKDDDEDDDEDEDDEENGMQSMNSNNIDNSNNNNGNSMINRMAMGDGRQNVVDDDDDDEDEEDDDVKEVHALDDEDDDDEEDDVDEEEDDVDDDEEEQAENNNDEEDDDETAMVEGEGFSCELCNIYFKTAKKLRQHVTEHFLNGTTNNNNNTNAKNDNSLSGNGDAGAAGGNDDNARRTSSSGSGSASSSSNSSMDDTTNDGTTVSSNGGGGGRNTKDGNSQMTPQEHQQFAAISQELKCRICGTVCADQLDVMTCMASHQTPTSLKCSECQLFFNTPKQVMDHELLYHPKGYIV